MRNPIRLECPKMGCKYKPGATGLMMDYENYDVDKDYPCDICGEPMVPIDNGEKEMCWLMGITPSYTKPPKS